MAVMKHADVMLRPDPSRTVIRPFAPDYPDAYKTPGHTRRQAIVDRVLGFSDAELERQFASVREALEGDNGDVEAVLDRRFADVADSIPDARDCDENRRRLIGAYLSEEYAFEAAALFNPSVVLHPDQTGAADGAVRFLMSLRSIGEGHVSSVTFRTGLWDPRGAICVDAPSKTVVAPIIDKQADDGLTRIRLNCGDSRDISETVLFPITPAQKQGIEDLRLTAFVDDDGARTFYGTYTAFSGSEARSELLQTADFRSFELQPMTGSAAAAKGMALFPRRINGRYAMLGRQDSENVWLLYSDDLLHWDGGERLLGPAAPWEAVQIGNCGAPIELDEGWLVLTHGVGAVRTYSIGACLLDKADPSRVLARSREPILVASPEQRNGYVPNVVYSCGGLVQDRTLLLPYGVADTLCSFATASVEDVLAMLS